MLETDYLVIGAGAASMAFVDTLLTESPDVSVTIVDRHKQPGGHWNDAYGFVRLHQPSLLYGVASKQLEGNWLKLLATGTLPWTHRASKQEILAYYRKTMDAWISSGRVQYFPESSYDFENSNGKLHRFMDDRSNKTFNIKVREKLVNGVIGECQVPSQTPPSFPVSKDITMLTPNQVFDLKADSWRGRFSNSANLEKKFVVLGAGKTAMDTVVFLQRNLRVSPSNITWVIPNDVWMLRRNGKGSPWSWGEALVEKNLDSNKAALYLESQGIFTRLDKNIVPTRFRFPVVGDDELSYMQKVTSIVRRGRVTAISAANDSSDDVEIQFGTNEPLVLGSENHIFVHCTSPGPFNGGQNNTPFPSDDEIRLTFLYAPPVPISMSCLAALESQRRKGELDLEVGRKLLGTEKAADKVSANDALRCCIPGYSLSNNDGLSSTAASQHIEPLKHLAGFLALYDKDPKAGYRWMHQNRLSFFSIPGFKGKVYENLCQVIEKKQELGLEDNDVLLFSGLAEKLKPLEGW